MKIFILAFAMLTAQAASACADFSGIFFDEDGGSCVVARQTGCERFLQTLHFRTAPPLTTDYITDGQLRRYPVERSMQKAIHYDEAGRQVFLGLHDVNGRIDGLYTKLADGNVHMALTWTDVSGETAQFESLLVRMDSLENCKQRL